MGALANCLALFNSWRCSDDDDGADVRVSIAKRGETWLGLRGRGEIVAAAGGFVREIRRGRPWRVASWVIYYTCTP